MLLTLLLGLITNKAYAYQQEEITKFDSHIVINTDSSLTVTENIGVYALGDKIKHGIYRDFPTNYKDAGGLSYQTSFDVLEVFRDSVADSSHTEKLSNGTRLYIGDSNAYINSGLHTYTINYRTENQLGFFKDHDELYFNVTGNGWDFIINDATATVQLPDGVDTAGVKLEAYTGSEGDKGTNYTSEVYSADGKNYAFFKTTSPLYIKQGLTIVVGWPKGFVTEPTQSQKVLAIILHNIMAVIGLIFLLVVVGYYLVVWPRYGRDPAGTGTVVTQFEIAKEISPAGARYINRMGFDTKAVTASLINMAIKGYLRIKEEKKEFSIELAENTSAALFDEEKVLGDRFFLHEGKVFKFKDTNADRIGTTTKLYKKSLESKYLDKYVKNNRGFLIVPVVINLVFLIIIGATNPANFFLFFWLAFWSMGVIPLANLALRPLVDYMFSRTPIKPSQIGLCLFAAPFVLAEVVVLSIVGGLAGPIPAAELFGMFILNAVGSYAMKVRTPLGRRIEDQILGLKNYLTAVERPRYLSAINYETPDSLKVYEKYLPYAVALDVEPIWTSRFKEQIDAVRAANDQHSGLDYTSVLYAGSTLSGSLGSALTSAISASSSHPGSSSGFSGSGGGGGSSGGGGW